MIGKKVKPSTKLTGLRYRWSENGFSGRLYTAMPLRIITARRNALVAGGAFTLFRLWNEPCCDVGYLSMFMGVMSLFYGVLAYPLFLLFDPGKRIKLTREELAVGFKRYDLGSIGSFRSVPMNEKKQHVHYLVFDYGTKFIKLPIKNRANHQMQIAQALNEVRQTMTTQPATVNLADDAPSILRSAEF